MAELNCQFVLTMDAYCHYTKAALAGGERLELPCMVLKTTVLPIKLVPYDGAHNQNRTDLLGLGSRCSTDELYAHRMERGECLLSFFAFYPERFCFYLGEEHLTNLYPSNSCRNPISLSLYIYYIINILYCKEKFLTRL